MKPALGALVLAASARVLACPAAADVAQADLLGTWHAQVDGGPAVSLTLQKHPEFAETVRGFVERDGRRIAVAGDVDDGEFTLEESDDGRRISATWLGDVVEGSCGREIRGRWQAEGTLVERPFVLRKRP
ncbi:hypothetical protein [Ramlibacter sp. PS4R-6]|uniref:hypothetical protein n=1 Tax=Ramlibacter sp. PS4R-6 TaxID=3133438 RepID=UPI0030AD918B